MNFAYASLLLALTAAPGGDEGVLRVRSAAACAKDCTRWR